MRRHLLRALRALRASLSRESNFHVDVGCDIDPLGGDSRSIYRHDCIVMRAWRLVVTCSYLCIRLHTSVSCNSLVLLVLKSISFACPVQRWTLMFDVSRCADTLRSARPPFYTKSVDVSRVKPHLIICIQWHELNLLQSYSC